MVYPRSVETPLSDHLLTNGNKVNHFTEEKERHEPRGKAHFGWLMVDGSEVRTRLIMEKRVEQKGPKSFKNTVSHMELRQLKYGAVAMAANPQLIAFHDK